MSDFAMNLGLEELGARTVENGRGTAALRKVGAASDDAVLNGLVLKGRAVSTDDRPRRKIVWDLRSH